MNEIDKIINEFLKIKGIGFVKSRRARNNDGNIGNTFEDLLRVKENNLKEADYLGFEVKSRNKDTSSFVSLFTKSPSYPEKANTYLRQKFGEVRDENHRDIKKLYASVFGHRNSCIYQKYNMILEIDKVSQLLYLSISDLESNILERVYWTFDDLKKASNKLSNLLLVQAESKIKGKHIYYHYNYAELYSNFSFEKFIDAIINGDIMFDLRLGVYSSQKKYGQTHDHGSGFRIKFQNFYKLYESYEILE